jgi:hypothetical protein
MIRVLSLGAGVQSSTLLLMSCQGELPKLDAAIFADTQWEPATVYSWLEFLKRQASAAGIPLHVVTAGNLRQDALDFMTMRVSGDGKRHASMPLYVRNKPGAPNKKGVRGIIRRQCTGSYKIDMIERCIRREILGLAPGQRAPNDAVEQWIGISADEPQRAGKLPSHWQRYRYPLMDDLDSPKKDTLFGRGYDRQDCLDWMERNGYPRPPRSACIGCPFHSDDEWRALTPEEFEDACQFDEEMRQRDAASAACKGMLVGTPYLHSSLVPLRMVKFGAVKEGIKDSECQGMCGV